MSKRPEKKELFKGDRDFEDYPLQSGSEKIGYSQCVDDFNAYLPDSLEIMAIIYCYTNKDGTLKKGLIKALTDRIWK